MSFCHIVCVGGTADITVHQRQGDGTLRELHKASGGAWGGTKVDEEFYQLIIRIIGAPAWYKFTETQIADFLDLQRELETKKRTITPASNGMITTKVPISLSKIYKNDSGEGIDEAIDGSNYTGKLEWMSDKLHIDAGVFKNLFKSCSDKIVGHIKELLAMPDVKGTHIFLLVGGFSESAMLQDAIIKGLPQGSKVIIPDEAGLCVLKGAVMLTPV